MTERLRISRVTLVNYITAFCRIETDNDANVNAGCNYDLFNLRAIPSPAVYTTVYVQLSTLSRHSTRQ